MRPTLHIGTSGFASPSARGSLQSASGAAHDRLASYARTFGAVEMDSAFYRPPSRDTVAGWADTTPEDFAFTVRVPRQITHVDRMRMAQRVGTFAETLQLLGPRLRCLLFTTPPTLDCDIDRVRAALEALPKGVRTAWEFRHPSWHRPDVFDLLLDHGSTPVIVETFEGLNGSDALPGGTVGDKWDLPFYYLRFRKDRYRAADLFVWAEVLTEAAGSGRPLFGFFRQSGEALAYATALTELLEEGLAGPAPRERALDGQAGSEPGPRARALDGEAGSEPGPRERALEGEAGSHPGSPDLFRQELFSE